MSDRAEIESAIRRLCARRSPPQSCSLAEVARELAPDDWRPMLPEVRAAARALARSGQLELVREGQLLDPDSPIRGPVRLRRRQSSPVRTWDGR